MKIKCNIKVALILTSVVGLILLGVLFFGNNMVLFDPKGPVGQAQESLIITSVLLMAIIIVPVLFMCVYFPYKYRSSNKEAEYKPNWEHSTKIEVVGWAGPC